ncbi:heat-shock protein Hsp70 [Cronobacter condimenti 1330]|uniref:Heat-shock protein Hsp70 n=1 Tax=Cronobacter condimenti 1330 TaxID=1073999 RepID=A0ABN4I5T0_9ENTR|nr:molecular chaperone HscC [Cronobacter condimenti]ALB61913.1 heat-shock protein Hsp70 [Cronobacter condimenti 1330]
METTTPLIGIDLGTSNSAVAWFTDGRATLIADGQKKVLTPSVVGLDDDGHLIVGEAAKARLVSHPTLTHASFKRYMGTDKVFTLGEHRFRAEELSALVLRKLKADAEVSLGCALTRAVITVPAWFNDIQRKAVKTAGHLAGLTVERLVNEPTAASLAYGLADNREQKFLVFDLGGGTFDVSIVDMFEGVIEVRASSGDARLGGDDFTDIIRQWMLSRYPDYQPDGMHHDEAQLVAHAESLKYQLTHQALATATFNAGGHDMTWQLDNDTFTDICQPLLARLKQPVIQALRDARFDIGDLDDVILVGGATRMPVVRQLAARMFGRFPRAELNPDEVVALGAGIQAGLASLDAALDDIVLTDVMPFSLGIETSRRNGERYDTGYFLPIIERNSFVPVSMFQSISTVYDNQRQLDIVVYQGEARRVSENILLDKFTLNIPPRPAGEVTVDVRFTYTLDGILEVECKVDGQEQVASLVIERAPGSLSPEEIQQRLAQLNALKIHPRDRPENRQLLAQASLRYEQTLGERRHLIDHYSGQFEQALESQDLRIIASARQALEQILAQFDDGLR